MFNFNPDKINFEEELGSGASGTVYPYQKDPNDKKWVVKNVVTKDVKDVIRNIQEIVLGFNCDSPHVLPVRGYHIDYNKETKLWSIYIKLPRMKGSLRSLVNEHKKENKPIPEEKIVQCFYAVALGVQYLHNKSIAHRDIKPDNVLMGEDGSLKVADFGLGNFIGGEASYVLAEKVGALFYVSPENQDEKFQLKKKDLFRADLWSLGMLILELCNLDLRFIDFSASGKQKEDDIMKKVQSLNGKYSDSLLELILSLLRSDPAERKDLEEVRRELEEKFEHIITKAESEQSYKEVRMRSEMFESFENKRIQELEEMLRLKDEQISALESRCREVLMNNEMNRNQIPQIPSQITPQGPWQVPGQYPGQVPWQVPGQTPGQAPWQIPGQTPGQVPWQVQGQYPRQYPIQFPTQMPPQIPQQITGQTTPGMNPFQQNKLTIKELKDNLESKYAGFFKFDKLTNKGFSLKLKDYKASTTLNILRKFMTNWSQISHHYVDMDYVTLGLRDWKSDEVNQGILEFGSLVGPKMQNLMQFGLNASVVGGSGHLRDEAIEELAIQIGSHLKNLRGLSIDLHAYNWLQRPTGKLTDQAVKSIAIHVIGSLKNLRTLKLGFSGNSNITDEGVKELGKQIGLNLKELQSLELYFTYCPNITDEGLRLLTINIGSNLKKLEYVQLSFMSTKATEAVRKFTLNYLKYVPQRLVDI